MPSVRPSIIPDALVGDPPTASGPGRPSDMVGPFVVEVQPTPALGGWGFFTPEDDLFLWWDHDHEHCWIVKAAEADGDRLVVDAVGFGVVQLRPLSEADQWVHADDAAWPLPALVAHARRLLNIDQG